MSHWFVRRACEFDKMWGELPPPCRFRPSAITSPHHDGINVQLPLEQLHETLYTSNMAASPIVRRALLYGNKSNYILEKSS